MNNTDKEVLSIAQEECAEVIQAISKIFRFGYEGKHPNESMNNLERLEEELGDLQAMVELMLYKGIVREQNILDAKYKKFDKLKKWSNIYNKGNE